MYPFRNCPYVSLDTHLECVVKTNSFVRVDVVSIYYYCGLLGMWQLLPLVWSVQVQVKSDELTYDLYLALPLTIATPIARQNCWSMIGKAPPLRSVLTSCDILSPWSPAAASRAKRVMTPYRSLLQCNLCDVASMDPNRD